MNDKRISEERPKWDLLHAVSSKLRGLAYLIESQRGDLDPPVDLLTIHWGLGRLLTELSQTVEEVSRRLEVEEIE